jgi:(E)-4-hydroxy-3-methyl-but-2-enyl pyrophosphate reductase
VRLLLSLRSKIDYLVVMGLKVIVTPEGSFCPGVDRAIRITEENLFGKGDTAYSIGPLIHNPEVVSRLEILGLKVLEPGGPYPDLDGIKVIVRSHGIDIETERELLDRGAVLVDATCPTVKKAQKAASSLARRGYSVLVLGSAEHPEVRSIVGRTGADVRVVDSPGEALEWAAREDVETSRVGVVCQTTISRDLLTGVVRALEPTVGELAVEDTICAAVARRRAEALRLCGKVDLMLVVGGYNSSNTAHLAQVCAESGVETRHIESREDVDEGWLEGVKTAGIAGGASTPDWQVEDVAERLREIAG